jgi:hypothetical protein
MQKIMDIAMASGLGYILFMALLVIPPDDTLTLLLCAFAFIMYGWILHTVYNKRWR